MKHLVSFIGIFIISVVALSFEIHVSIVILLSYSLGLVVRGSD